MKARQFRHRAQITIDLVQPRPGALHPPARQYPSHTRALMIAALPLRADRGPARLPPAEIWWDGDEPEGLHRLRPVLTPALRQATARLSGRRHGRISAVAGGARSPRKPSCIGITL